MVFSDDFGASADSSVVFVGNEFSVKLIIKKIENVKIFIVAVMNNPVFIFIVNINHDRLLAKHAQLDAFFQETFCTFHVGAISAMSAA